MANILDTIAVNVVGSDANQEITRTWIELGDGTYAQQTGEAPAANVALITPNDSVDLTKATRGISFAAAGALKVVTVGGQTVTIPDGALAAGIIHPIRVTRVWSTGTGATGIVGFY